MFRKRGGDGLLPTTASSSAPARAKAQLPRVSCATGGTYIWLLVSLGVVFLGVRFLGTPTDLRHLTCGSREETCTLVVDTEDDERVTHEFAGGDLLRAELVRVRRGRAVNVKHMRRKQVRKLGYSYQLVVKLDDEGAEARHVMSYGTIGRGRARERVDEVSEYATKKPTTGQDRGDSTSLQRGCSRSGFREDSSHALSSPREMIARPKMSHIEWKTIELRAWQRRRWTCLVNPFPPRRTTALDVKESSGVSAVGILLIIYGAFSLIFCLILGQFKEPPPPRKRK